MQRPFALLFVLTLIAGCGAEMEGEELLAKLEPDGFGESIEPDVDMTPEGAGAEASHAFADEVLMTDTASLATAQVTVTTKEQLISALSTATPGTRIWIPGTVQMDLTRMKAIVVPAGVTIASDRGAGGPGALLFSNENDLSPRDANGNYVCERWHLFKVVGDDVRFTGLRIRGADTEIGSAQQVRDCTTGILVNSGTADFIVDHTELWGWSWAAISLTDSTEGYVWANYIHHNRRTRVGYGIQLVANSSAIISQNTFAYNRHAIAGTGIVTQRYDARYNYVSSNPTGHTFDMHGYTDACATCTTDACRTTYCTDKTPAGNTMYVWRNTFRDATYAAFLERGLPVRGVYTGENCYRHTSTQSPPAIHQIYYTGRVYRDTLGASTFNTSTGVCHGASAVPVQYKFSSGAVSAWTVGARYTYDIPEIGFGDFNGDKKTDVFRATGRRWYYSSGAKSDLVSLGAHNEEIGRLRFGDFNHDGKTDVFTAEAGQWKYWPTGGTGWVNLAASGAALVNLYIGDFDGDGFHDDVFNADGTRWSISMGGTAAPVVVMTSGKKLDSIAFGDFNGDGRTDVFHHNPVAARWQYFDVSTRIFNNLATSTLVPSTLRVADVTGDGRADVVYFSSGFLHISSGGATAFTRGAGMPCSSINKIHLADFDGVIDATTGKPRADAFAPRCGE